MDSTDTTLPPPPSPSFLNTMMASLKGIPSDVIRYAMAVQHYLAHEQPVAAFNYLKQPEISTDAQKETLRYLERQYKKKPNQSFVTLQQMFTADTSLTEGQAHDATKISNFEAFDAVTKDVSNTACLQARLIYADSIFQKRSGGDGPADAHVLNMGGKYAREAIEGYATLGMVKECTEALGKIRSTYGQLGGVDYIDWALGYLSDPGVKSFTLARAVLHLSNKADPFEHLTLQQKELILQNCTDETLTCKLVDNIGCRDHGEDHEPVMKDRMARVEVLINYLQKGDKAAGASYDAALSYINKITIDNILPIQRTYYDMVLSELPKGNPAVLALFDTTGKIETFIADYDRFKYDESRDRVPTKITDLIPQEIKGPHAIVARNKLAGALFQTVERLYQEAEAPSPTTSALMDAALYFTVSALADGSLSADNKHKQKSMWLMREITLAQRVKEKTAKEDHEQTLLRMDKTVSHENKQRYIDQHNENMKPLSSAGLALHHLENVDNSDIREIAKKIRENINQQQEHMPALATTVAAPVAAR